MRRGDHLFANEGLEPSSTTATPPAPFADLEIPLRVIATDLDTGEEVVLARGPAEARAARERRAPRRVPDRRTTTAARLVDGGVVNTVPLWHALAGPVDRVFVLNVSGELMRPRRALAARRRDDEPSRISRNQRFELELRSVPETSR